METGIGGFNLRHTLSDEDDVKNGDGQDPGERAGNVGFCTEIAMLYIY